MKVTLLKDDEVSIMLCPCKRFLSIVTTNPQVPLKSVDDDLQTRLLAAIQSVLSESEKDKRTLDVASLNLNVAPYTETACDPVIDSTKNLAISAI
jgi:hypothetical protein